MMYVPRVIVPPSQEPVTLGEAKGHLRVTGTSEDDYITSLIVAAREYCEEQTGRAFYQQTLEITFDQWPWEWDFFKKPESYRFTLPRATPLVSVTSIIYTDQSSVLTTWGASNYQVDTDSIPGQIVLPYGSTWPEFNLTAVNGVRVRYIAGYVEPSPSVPFSYRVKQAMYLLIGNWYENREATTIGTLMQSDPLKMGVDSLLSGLVIPGF